MTLGTAQCAEKPNVLFIICDDLNDYIGALDGHPQVRTPNIDRLFASGVSFTQAHWNVPICAPSRASLFTGLYPHTSRNFGMDNWDENAVLKNNRTLMDHFQAQGYQTLGTGKIMHNRDRKLIRLFHQGEKGAHRYLLFNLRDDLGETRDLAAQEPVRVQELDARIEKFLTDTQAVVPIPNPKFDPAKYQPDPLTPRLSSTSSPNSSPPPRKQFPSRGKGGTNQPPRVNRGERGQCAKA